MNLFWYDASKKEKNTNLKKKKSIFGKVAPKFLFLQTLTQDETSIAPLEVVTLVSMSSKPKAVMASISLVNPPLFFSKMIFIQSLFPPIWVTSTSA